MVQDLMEIIAAPCDLEQLAGSKSAEEAALDAGELSALAVHLLRMLLHLYGGSSLQCSDFTHGSNSKPSLCHVDACFWPCEITIQWASVKYASCASQLSALFNLRQLAVSVSASTSCSVSNIRKAHPSCSNIHKGAAVPAGVAEDAGMFLRHGTSRVTTSGGLENVRMGLETALLEGLVGSGQVVPELTQKRAVLCALRPKDRMRLLSMARLSNCQSGRPHWGLHHCHLMSACLDNQPT